jgi:hypothetical protein
MVGLQGLQGNINTTDDAIRDLSVLEKMDQRIQYDKEKEVEAQKQEELMYERAYQMSDKLLEKDRIAINKRIAMFQGQVTSHLKDSGGSRKSFMENGGLSVMNKITNSIMRSDEAVRYQENKKNLAKIIEAKDKGLGHLIAPTDLQSLEDYENSEAGGQITYSGIMSEIEIPPSANFDYGTDIPLEKILSNKSNMMRIKANYKINYPERPEPDANQIYQFAKKMGYGGTGSSTARMQLASREAMKKAQYDAKRASQAKTHKNSYLGQMEVLKSQVKPGMSIQDINEKYDGNMIEALSKDNPSFNKLLSSRFTQMSRKRNLTEEGPDPTDLLDAQDSGPLDNIAQMVGYFANDKMGLKEAYNILPYNQKEMGERAFHDATVENGYLLDFEPAETDFRMDGVKLTGAYKLDDQHKGKYKLLGTTTALKAKMTSDNGEEALLMNAYDDDGTLDKKSTAKMDEAYGDSETILTTVMAYENEDGNIFYRELEMSDPQIRTVFSNALAEDDNIQPQVDQDKRSAQEIYLRERMQSEEELNIRGAITEAENQIFSKDGMQAEEEEYYGAHSGGQLNRNDMMKSFYLAFDYVNNSNTRNEDYPQGDRNVHPAQVQLAMDKNLFTESATMGGIVENLKDYDTQGNSVESMINSWLTNMNSDTKSALGQRTNSEIAQKWNQIFSLMETSD